jgi:hypothetical protein
MTSTRPYRQGMTIEKALSIISENLGKQFDQEIGIRLIALGKDNKLDHIVGHSDLGIPLHHCPMCGPIIVLKRSQQKGDHVYCRSCGGESIIDSGETGLILKSTGSVGTAEQIKPDIDEDIINSLTEITCEPLMKKSAWSQVSHYLAKLFPSSR